MRRSLIIFTAVTKNWMRSRSGIFFSIMFPVMLLLVFGAIFGGVGGPSTYGLFVQNLDRTADGTPTELSDGFVEALNSTNTFDIRNVPVDADATSYARDSLGPLGGNIRILIIPDGFQDDLLNGTLKVRVGISYVTLLTMYEFFERYLSEAERMAIQQGLAQMGQYNASIPDRDTSLTLILDASDQSSAIVKGIVMNIASAFNYHLVGARAVINFTEESIAVRQFRTVDFYVPGIIAAFIMSNGIIGVTTNTTEFKRRGIIKRLSITPLSKIEWILGNVLSQTLLNLMLTAIMIVIGWLLFNVQAIPDVYSLLLIFLGSLMFSGIGMVLSGLVKDVEAASAIGNAIAFPMMFLSGTYFPLEFMPEFLQSFARVLPLTYFSDGLRYAMIYKYSEGIFTNMAIISVLAVAFIILGSVVTRWKEK
ncbi:MAG: ABC transporter permease [Aigarchaeota archaeon]|nr:ABC transporter permease [Aigarchaeota archaeon]